MERICKRVHNICESCIFPAKTKIWRFSKHMMWPLFWCGGACPSFSHPPLRRSAMKVAFYGARLHC